MRTLLRTDQEFVDCNPWFSYMNERCSSLAEQQDIPSRFLIVYQEVHRSVSISDDDGYCKFRSIPMEEAFDRRSKSVGDENIIVL